MMSRSENVNANDQNVSFVQPADDNDDEQATNPPPNPPTPKSDHQSTESIISLDQTCLVKDQEAREANTMDHRSNPTRALEQELQGQQNLLKTIAAGGITFKDQIQEARRPNPMDNVPAQNSLEQLEIAAHLVLDDEDERDRIRQEARDVVIANAAVAEVVDEAKLWKERTIKRFGVFSAIVVIFVGSITGSFVALQQRNDREDQLACDAGLILQCQTQDGRPCEELLRPSTLSCFETFPLDSKFVVPGSKTLRFLYDPADCNASTNVQRTSCGQDDSKPNGSSSIYCYPSREYYAGSCLCCPQNELLVSPTTVEIGNTFVLSSTIANGTLFPLISCHVQGQNVTIDSSGRSGLNLLNRFGSLLLVGCNNLDCLQELKFSLQIQNKGSETFTVSNLDVLSNLNQLVDGFSVNDDPASFPPGDIREYDVVVEFNACSNMNISVAISAALSLLSNNSTCQVSNQLDIAIQGRIPLEKNQSMILTEEKNTSNENDCGIEVDLTCVLAGESDKCFPVPVPCWERYWNPCKISSGRTDATFLFNGGTCEQSSADVVFSCRDYDGGPGIDIAQLYYIVVKNSMDVSFYEGYVSIGDQFTVMSTGMTNNNTLAPDALDDVLNVRVHKALGGVVVQEIMLHPSCYLKEYASTFGSIQLINYNVPKAPFVFPSVPHVEVPISVVGEQINLTSMLIRTNFAGILNVTSDVVGKTTGPGGNVVVTLVSDVIDASLRRLYTMNFEFEGVQANGSICKGTKTLSFETIGSPEFYV